MKRQSFSGRVVSAQYSQFLTDKYGDTELNLCGYSLHILIDRINGESLNKHCLELQCYSDFVKEEGGKIKVLKLVKPLFEKNGITIAGSAPTIKVGESRIDLVGYSFKRKVKNEKEYRMLKTGLPLCVIKQPLITKVYLEQEEEEEETYTSNIKIISTLKQEEALV